VEKYGVMNAVNKPGTVWISLSKYMNHKTHSEYPLLHTESTWNSSIFYVCLEWRHELMLYKSKIRISIFYLIIVLYCCLRIVLHS
jgi:hypothetical protein